ncbi:MAG: hypothetical protein WC595_01505 [Candidatus Nanoarchaeia archaeon]
MGIREDDGSLGWGRDRWDYQVVSLEDIPVEAFEAVVVEAYNQDEGERLVRDPVTDRIRKIGERLIEVFPESVGVYSKASQSNAGWRMECFREAKR